VRSGEVVAEVVRSGFVESEHRGSVVALNPDGSVGWSLGPVEDPIFPRSSNKPIQAVGMLRCGLDLDGELLALGSASHSGEPFHLAGVRRILGRAGLEESALRTPADFPIDPVARDDYVRAGGAAAPIAMNCSGKHAAMLATCVAAGWPTDSYRSPEHPLQVALAGTFAELTGAPVAAVGVDGCGAPLFATSLVGLATAFRAIVRSPEGTPERRVAAAVAGHPEWVSGTRRDEAAFLRAFPGALAKAGAEACYAVALPDGRAFAVKIDDGGGRARPVVMAAALRRFGVEHPVLDELASATVLGGGEPVGEVRATF
jgi:L-asparaginase II